MKKALYLFSGFLILSLVLAACTPAATQPATQPATTLETQAPAATTAVETTPETTSAAIAPTAETTEMATASPAATEAAATAAVTPAMEGTMTPSVIVPETTATAMMTATTAVSGTGNLPSTGPVNVDRVSGWINLPILSSDGKVAGQVQDLIIDLAAAKVAYVVVHLPGEHPADAANIPVPWEAFNVTPNAAPTLKVDAASFEGAPTLDLNAVKILEPSDWQDSFMTYWQTTSISASLPAEPGAGTPTPQPATPMTGLVLSKELIGQQLKAANGAVSGSITDILLDPASGQVTYVLVSATTPSSGAKTVPVPIQLLVREASTRTFSLPPNVVTLLNTAPSIDLSNLPPDWQTTLQTFWKTYLNR